MSTEFECFFCIQIIKKEFKLLKHSEAKGKSNQNRKYAARIWNFQRRKECNKFHFPIFYVELPKLRWVFHRSLGRVVGMHRFPGSQGACSHGRWNSVRCCIIQLERSGQPKCTKARRYAKCKSQEWSQRVEYSSPLVPLSTIWDENTALSKPNRSQDRGWWPCTNGSTCRVSRVIPYHWT